SASTAFALPSSTQAFRPGRSRPATSATRRCTTTAGSRRSSAAANRSLTFKQHRARQRQSRAGPFHASPMQRAECMYAILAKTVNAWIEHRAGSKGAALAFYTLFSLTPILVLAIAVAGYFFGAEAAQGEIMAQVE